VCTPVTQPFIHPSIHPRACAGVQEELLKVRKDLLKDTLAYFKQAAEGDAKVSRA
jgi:hypothetical protein